MAKRKAPPKVRSVYERDPGSGVWWICYKQGTVRKHEKVGSRGNAIAGKSELRTGAKLPANIRKKGITFGQLAAEALLWSEEFHPKDIRTVKSRMQPLVEEFGAYAAADIKPQAIDQWLTEHGDWKPATKNRYRALLSLVYRQKGCVTVR